MATSASNEGKKLEQSWVPRTLLRYPGTMKNLSQNFRRDFNKKDDNALALGLPTLVFIQIHRLFAPPGRLTVLRTHSFPDK